MELSDLITPVSWIFSFLAVYGSYLLAKGSIHGFSIGVVSNGAFCLLNIYRQDYAQAFLFLINLLISIHGIRVWRRKRKGPVDTTGTAAA